MQLKSAQLEQHLQRGLRPLYVVTGDEPLLAMEAADVLRAVARREGYSEREVISAERDFNWASLKQSGSSLSLFATRRLLEIRIPTGKPGNDGGQALQDYCADLPPDTVTLVTLPKLDKKTGQNSVWFKALESAGVVVEVFPVALDALPEWIGRRLSAQRQGAGREALQFLAQQVEGNLLAAHHEIQKLGLLFPPRTLSIEEVSEAVLNVSRFDVFQLGDAMLVGDVARLVRVLDGLKGEGVKPIPILGVLAWLIRGLAKASRTLSGGGDFMTAMRQANIWGERQSLARRALGRVTTMQLENALQHASEIDRISKGLKRGDAWDELLQLCLGLAQNPAHAKSFKAAS